MINPNELRKGNIVMVNGDKTVVEMIWPDGINEDVQPADTFNFSTRLYADYELDPIPITTKLLERCGFEFKDGLHKFGVFEIGMDGDDFLQMKMSVRINRAVIVKLQYLHQLQNIYFALTGEELTIKL